MSLNVFVGRPWSVDYLNQLGHCLLFIQPSVFSNILNTFNRTNKIKLHRIDKSGLRHVAVKPPCKKAVMQDCTFITALPNKMSSGSCNATEIKNKDLICSIV